MEQLHSSVVFLGCMIFASLGGIVALACILIANNMIHRFWKPLNWGLFSVPYTFQQDAKQEAKTSLR